jgi:catechol 2,3-dioxygenase-like lactoylglutathione lyase family enzyme
VGSSRASATGGRRDSSPFVEGNPGNGPIGEFGARTTTVNCTSTRSRSSHQFLLRGHRIHRILGVLRRGTDRICKRLDAGASQCSPRARINKLHFLRCGHGNNLEVFEYASPDQRTELPKNSGYGGNHLAYYVDDFDAALRYLKDKSVRILGEPTVREEGPNGGITWVYFLAPWGLQIELVSFPKGKGYEKTRPDRLWHPAFPAQ